jgi:hypothetical protein
MANIAIFKAGQPAEYLESVNTLDYLTGVPSSKDQAQAFAKPGVLINPDISAVKDVPRKYWKRVGDQIKEMTAAEKTAVDNAEKSARDVRIDNLEDVDAIVLAKALIKAGVITKAALVQRVKEVLNG